MGFLRASPHRGKDPSIYTRMTTRYLSLRSVINMLSHICGYDLAMSIYFYIGTIFVVSAAIA